VNEPPIVWIDRDDEAAVTAAMRVHGKVSLDVAEARHMAELFSRDRDEGLRVLEGVLYRWTGKILNLTGRRAEPPKPNRNCKP
jgi:hypothetical protein